MRSNASLVGELAEMHTYCRPHGTPGDQIFRRRYILPLLDLDYVDDGFTDSFGNIHVFIGSPRVVWSCHTDTVHSHSGRQRVSLSHKGILSVTKRDKKRVSCLGADDTVGVFLCRQLILAGVEGHYIFHYGEERGCIGSSSLASKDPALLLGAEIAIAFDRAGTRDVITHQCSMRTASNAFAQSLSDQLNRVTGLEFRGDDGGVFTDTNEYRDLIPECTNVSVGYYRAHSPHENVDTSHVLRLLSALLQLDQSALVVARDPNVPDPEDVAREIAREKAYNDRFKGFSLVGRDWTQPKILDLDYEWDEDEDEDKDDPTLPRATVAQSPRYRDLFLDPEYAAVLDWLARDEDEDPRYN